ncbi:MAG: response regulator transcription factor [Eubacterium aggregans]|uniref:Stage 0 sporulation protein A homolog n=1 Tax=Eubacterium aggregans TaxID=81409 RepID=A0A1H4DFG6_9FIRM|nr:response regulator transcription factor [Eubacterium aggregans]MDD4691436.1 response regulator transcription factor [Eubacterium aggregans]MEA5073504.1 response regulator transcription factor [Eubacterium aggregans]SEA71169.1 two-component system, OmpR family, alkaline phosphatase synthesis response regulator PhoP [Eubacterium aggregans]
MIYIVEDDAGIRELVMYTLQNSGYRVCGFEQGDGLFSTLSDPFPELILLDIMLPGEDGIQILKKLRQDERTKAIPIIMLTAKSAEYDKVIGLDNGADDYVTKPFGMMELLSRIKAVLRRSTPQPESQILSYKNILIDERAHQATVDGTPVDLTLKEYNLLNLLMHNIGTVLTRDMLLSKIWGYDFDGETRTVDVHIRTLRQKLGEEHPIIETVRGVGYRIGGHT